MHSDVKSEMTRCDKCQKRKARVSFVIQSYSVTTTYPLEPVCYALAPLRGVCIILTGYYTTMVCQGPVLAPLRQYWPEGFSPRANASEGVPIRARGIP